MKRFCNFAMRLCLIGMMALAGPALARSGGAADKEQRPSGIKILETTEGPAFATSEGKVLYFTAMDRLTPGKPTCDGRRLTTGTHQGEDYPLPLPDRRRTCLEKWPPFSAPAKAAPVGRWTVVDRPDGISQWAYDGNLLYTSVRDRAPGDTNGVAERAWHVAVPSLDLPSGVGIRKTLEGLMLVRDLGTDDTQLLFTAGTSLYDRDGWEPLIAPEAGIDRGDWTVRRRPDGRTQWMFRGAPLFYAAETASDPDVRGLTPAMFSAGDGMPAGFGTRHTIVGSIFADARGRTVYTFTCNEETPVAVSCDLPGDPAIYRAAMCGQGEACARQWLPVFAAADDRPRGDWTIIDFPNPAFSDTTGVIGEAVPLASRIWAYKGRPLYTFADDDAPGETRGNGVRWFQASSFLALRVPGEAVRLGERAWPIASGKVEIAAAP